MADSPTNSNPPSANGTPGPKKPLSMETRLLLAFLLMGLVLFVTPYLYKPPVGPKRTEAAPTPKQAAQVAEKAPESSAQNVSAKPREMPGAISAPAEQQLLIETDLYRIKLDNRGAVVRSWELKKFKDHTGQPLQLVNTGALAKVPPPFSVSMKDEKAAVLLNYALFVEKRHPDGLGADYEFSDGRTLCRKSFQFAPNSYMSHFTSEVAQNGIPVAHLIEWRGGFGDPTVLNRVTAQKSVYYDVANSKLLTKDAKSAKDGPVTANGNYSFAGLDDTFFAFVVLPKDNASTEVRTVRDEVQGSPGGKEEPHVGAEIGGDSQNKFDVYVGPKDVDILKHVDPKLQQLIDWGWFWFIAQPLFTALHYINDRIMHNYGWSIVLITVIINLLLLPLRFTSLKSARKMQALQPQIAAINAKYKNLSLRDPKKAEQNQEVMDLYKKHGANPLGGCLPMVIQLPILYGFYKVLAVTIEMRNAPWLWVADLSQPEQLPIHLLPIIMIITQFIMQKMTPNPSMDPAQAKMMQFMPLMFGFFFYNMSSGLVLYWLTGNLVGILQQYLINRYTPAPVIITPKPALKKAIKR